MNPALPRLQEKALRLTTAPGVYLMKNKQGEIIYVGKAKNLKNRVTSYFRPHNKSHNDKVRRMVSQVEDFDYIVVGSEFEALVLECSLIKQNNPKYNILLKDDKGYHYIRISGEEYPRITAEKQRLEDGAEYLGPYTGSFGVTQAVDEVNRLFGLATCKRQPKSFGKERPCLQYHIRQCKGVCRGNIPAEEYREWVAQAVVYLKKGGEALYERLERKMEEAAEALDFEQAARIRDQLNAMRKLPQRQSVIMLHIDSADVVAFAQNGDTAAVAVLKVRNCKLVDKEDFLFYDVDDLAALRQAFFNQYYLSANELPRRILTDSDFEDSSLLCDYLSSKKGRRIGLLFPQKGEGRQLIEMAYKNAGEKVALAVSRTAREVTALQELQQLLGLSATPNRIEAYDISNLGDSHMVGGMVVYENGRPKKKDYRRFKIKDVAFQNDYAAMAEVLTRRLQHTDEGFGPLPDLILLDGGKGHVSAVLPVVTALAPGVPLFGMVKDSHHRTRAIAADGGELSISGNRMVFTFLSRLQDEVHRYTISYQQASHKKSSLSLALTKVEGIGPARAAALLKAFPTRAALLAADPAALQKAGRLSEKTAQAVYDFLHQA